MAKRKGTQKDKFRELVNRTQEMDRRWQETNANQVQTIERLAALTMAFAEFVESKELTDEWRAFLDEKTTEAQRQINLEDENRFLATQPDQEEPNEHNPDE
jgi:hypothetical protein